MAINLYGGKLNIENYVEAGATVTYTYNAPVYKTDRKDLAEEGDEEEPPTDEDEQMISRIKDSFYGDRDEARTAYRQMMGLTDRQLTRLVATLVDKGKVSPYCYGRELWRPLFEAGMYKASEQNWRRQIRNDAKTLR